MRISDWSSDVCSSDLGHSTQHAGIDGVASSLADLAKLHAGLWESPLITPEAAPWLPTSMAVPVDYDQVRIMDHWLGENRKEPNFCGIAPTHYLADPSRLERAYDALVAYERAFEAAYCVIDRPTTRLNSSH